ncbi:MAG: dephospho-CoA kinase [Ignavibacteriales bacterium]|nr:dephospho-CoA kinase [Ignavibacteriales bacterium]
MKRQKSGILKVGVTGGIGSGKSVVCKMFADLGVPVLYADEIAREISTSNLEVRTAIVSLLGTSAYDAGGTLDRSYVASRIFSDKKLQKKLNAIVHPEVEKELDGKVAELEQIGKKIVIVEAALIYEAGLDKKLDVVVVVNAEEDLRVDRLRSRDGTNDSDIRKRMQSQWNPQVKLNRADYVILNNTTIQELQEKVKFLHAIFQSL